MNLKRYDEAKAVSILTGVWIHLSIPSILAEGETFSLKVRITGYDALPFENLSNRLVFENCQGVLGMPESLQLEKGEWSYQIDRLKAVGPDVAVVRAVVEGSGKLGGDPGISSNPAWVFKDPAYRLFWGDIHVHTTYSNCHAWQCIHPEWCYEYAKNVSLLDFAAPADHLRGIVSENNRWGDLQKLASEYNMPGEFVSMLAFESSHAQGYGGDNNIYFKDGDADHFWIEREDMHGYGPKVHLKELWKQLDEKGKEYFTVPHHTARVGKYRHWEEDYYSPEHEPLFEIYSGWGSSEMRYNEFPLSGGNNDDPSYYVDALKAGTRFGVIASSDDHATLPGGQNAHRGETHRLKNLCGYMHKGLAAVRAPELTREALFEAMVNRDTYAATLSRGLVDMTIGDTSMGKEIKADDPLKKKREIRVRLTLQDANMARVTLMRNGEELETQVVRGNEVNDSVNEIVFTDDEPLEDISVKDAKFHPEPFAVYYVRVRDSQTYHQWTSPIWIDV